MRKLSEYSIRLFATPVTVVVGAALIVISGIALSQAETTITIPPLTQKGEMGHFCWTVSLLIAYDILSVVFFIFPTRNSQWSIEPKNGGCYAIYFIQLCVIVVWLSCWLWRREKRRWRWL